MHKTYLLKVLLAKLNRDDNTADVGSFAIRFNPLCLLSVTKAVSAHTAHLGLQGEPK